MRQRSRLSVKVYVPRKHLNDLVASRAPLSTRNIGRPNLCNHFGSQGPKSVCSWRWLATIASKGLPLGLTKLFGKKDRSGESPPTANAGDYPAAANGPAQATTAISSEGPGIITSKTTIASPSRRNSYAVMFQLCVSLLGSGTFRQDPLTNKVTIIKSTRIRSNACRDPENSSLCAPGPGVLDESQHTTFQAVPNPGRKILV